MAEWDRIGYSDSDMFQMQQEALRRVRQMQQRARDTVKTANAELGTPVPLPSMLPPVAPLPQNPPQSPAHQNNTRQHSQPQHNQQQQQNQQQNTQQQSQQQMHPSPHTPPPQPGGILGSLMGQGGGIAGLLKSLTGQSGGAPFSSIIGEDSPLGRALGELGLDHERLLLIGLLLLMLNEKADMTLLMALFYILI